MGNAKKQACALSCWRASSKGQFYAVLALAGFYGALLRFALQGLPLPWIDGFPTATLFVNTLGSFLIVVVFCAGQRGNQLSPELVKVLNRGFLGAFTTLSAVCVDADELVSCGNDLGAFLYIALTFALSFGAALAAMRLFGVKSTAPAQNKIADTRKKKHDEECGEEREEDPPTTSERSLFREFGERL